jgi:AcrR family transcriptional regulator
MNETKEKILDTAERLFGECGYSATSLRHIIAEAKVNLAAVHYHFGSKQDLLDQVILRKAGPLNEQRMRLLDQFEAQAAPGSASLEEILEAFVTPAILMERSPAFLKLVARMHMDEGIGLEFAERHFSPLIDRFLSALNRALPAMSERELLWKAHFAIGAMARTLISQPALIPINEQESPFRIAKMLVAFLSSGFRASLEKKIEVNS